MQNIRPSILQRTRKGDNQSGRETVDDAWVKEEKRMEAKRARLASYESQFRIGYSYDATQEERKGRVEKFQASHDMLIAGREKQSQREKELDRQFALNRAAVARQEQAEEDARTRARRQAAADANRLNCQIAERNREAKSKNRTHENEMDNTRIQEELSRKRTFLY